MKKFYTSKTYFCVATAFLTLLAVTVAAAYLDLGFLNPLLALGIAGLKAWLILLFFMNVRRENHLVWLAAGVGIFWLAIMFALTMSDFMTRR